jgi:AcrR family transcriptional regulator
MRKYELKKRAESQRETQLRIVEATMELHREKGPARTSLSEVARRAGVERKTLYRHFPDPAALQLACSGLFLERSPLPDAEQWAPLAGEARLLRGLSELYGWYARNEELLSRVLADADTDSQTREINALRFGPGLAAVRAALAQVLPRRKAARAMLDVALEFGTWQRLRQSGLSSEAAARTMVRAVLAV